MKQSAKLLSIAEDEPTSCMSHEQFAGWVRQCCAELDKFRTRKEELLTPLTRALEAAAPAEEVAAAAAEEAHMGEVAAAAAAEEAAAASVEEAAAAPAEEAAAAPAEEAAAPPAEEAAAPPTEEVAQ